MHRSGLILGWDAGGANAFGFGPAEPATSAPDGPIPFEGDGPLCCIAPTGSGKGRDFLIPNLLTYPGPIIALDPKGELSAVCGRARRRRGRRVAILDPFGVTDNPSDRLNPLDLFDQPGAQLECDAEMLATLLGEGHGVDKDPFWSDTATGITAGLIAHVASAHPPGERNLTTIRSYLHHVDLSHRLAELLDVGGLPSLVHDEFAAFLQHSGEKTRESVLSTATTFVKALGSRDVARCLEDSTIPLADITAGMPLDVFVTVPPEKLKSHRALIRLWIATLLTTIMRRKVIPERRTLLVLDEAAQLGTFEPLVTAATLMRGYGLQMITIWQDLAQMKTRYPADWATILNNSAALLAFGFGHFAAAKEYAEVLGLDPHELAVLPPTDAALAVRGEGTRKIRRMNYLADEMFRGMAEPNPYFQPARPAKGLAPPDTWLDKLERAREALQQELDDNERSDDPSDDARRILSAMVRVTEAIEEVGRLANVAPARKKARKRKPKDRGK